MMGINITVIVFILFIIIAQTLTPKEYDWKVNTISELAAQNYENRKVMQLGFIVFGVLLTGSIIFELQRGNVTILKSAAIIIYAMSVGISGIFSTQPFSENIPFDRKESKIHSFCAQIAGFSFCAGIVICLILTSDTVLKIIHGAFLLFVIGCSILFGKVPRYRGVFQRVMYIGSFMWLAFFFIK